jgi:cytosine/adenosine deaminase-related metal-dependent hydrolase
VAVLYRAGWVLPVSAPPIRDGWVSADRGRITGVGTADGLPADITNVIDLGRAAVLPGLVNAHTHLELSWMRGQVPPGPSMPVWAAQLIALRAMVSKDPLPPIVEAVREARAAGTSIVGDVTNTLAAYAALVESELCAAVFREVIGFNAANPDRVLAHAQAEIDALIPIPRLRASIVPHAPYSVTPDLLRAIASAAGSAPISVHLAESPDELVFLRDGTGAWRELLGSLGAWNDRWTAPGCSPVAYLDRLGLVSERLLAVHCVHATPDDLRCLADAGATVVTCPRSNRWTGAGTPPVEEFYASGVRVAIGTDSLASVDDLNLFSELVALHRLAPAVPAARLIESATRHGADALGFGHEYGTLDPGKCADLIAVQVPPGIEDVEEYLVGGIEPAAIVWLREY